MTAYIVALLLTALALLALLLEKTYFYLPPKELKRQAAQGDAMASTLYQAAAYGTSLKLLLWCVTGLAAAGGFVLFARVAPALFGFLLVALVLWLAFLWLPRARLSAGVVHLTIWCTPAVVEILRLLHPIIEYMAVYTGNFSAAAGPHTGLYEQEDLLDLIERQERQGDNRVDGEVLELLRRALRFGGYTVRDARVPRRRVTAVSLDEDLGPVVLDELHRTGHSQFPVYEGEATNIVGVLMLDDAAEGRRHSTVRGHCDRRLAYVHEDDSLRFALQVFYQSHHQLLIVVNGSGAYTGILTLRDVLQRLFDAAGHDADMRHDDRAAVAARHHLRSKPAGDAAHDAATEKLSENPSEVVE